MFGTHRTHWQAERTSRGISSQVQRECKRLREFSNSSDYSRQQIEPAANSKTNPALICYPLAPPTVSFPASHFSTTREVWLERLAWASLSGKYVHISFHAILNSDSKMPASTGQYGSQCGSITMRYSIIHSQCWLSIATYKYLRTRQ